MNAFATTADAGPTGPSASPATRPRRPWALLINALLDLAGPQAGFVAHAERPWASVTFAGSRHTVTLAFTGAAGVAAGEAFAEALPEHEFAIPRQIVADATVTGMLHEVAAAGRAEMLTIEAELLLVEDC